MLVTINNQRNYKGVYNMDELLKKLLAADILTEDTKVEIETAIKQQLDEAIVVAQADAKAQVTAELNEQWIRERDILIETLDAKVTETLTDELDELREDVERFRDLEAEYANKLVEAKSEMADTLKSDLAQLIEKMDAFLEVRLTAELTELQEDIKEVKKNEFGKNIFEAFIVEFKKHYAGDDSVESKLNETEMRLDDALLALESAEKKAAKLERKIKLEKVLTPLSGRSKEVMEAILRNVDTSMIEEAYDTYIGRVLKETTESSEKENAVLAEDAKTVTKEVTGVAKNGDDMDQIVIESVQRQQETHTSHISEAEKARLRKIAGI